MIKRLPTLMCCLPLLSSLALAQGGGTGDKFVQFGFDGLRTQTSIWARMSGTDTIRGRGTSFIIDAFFLSTFDSQGMPLVKLECNEYQNGVQVSRIVGDGATLWAYNFLRNEFAATTYNSLAVGGSKPTALKDMITAFTTHAKGQTAYVARMLREVYSGGMAQYRPWLVNPVTSLVQNPMNMQDPVLGAARIYQALPTTMFVVYHANVSMNRSMAFQLDDTQGGGKLLSKVFFAESSSVAGQPRMMEWTMSVVPVQAAVGNFVFVPPANAKPIVKPGGN